ncbi:MAG: hypothetical protein ACLSFZ_13670 [Frisingicoccus sp.]
MKRFNKCVSGVGEGNYDDDFEFSGGYTYRELASFIYHSSYDLAEKLFAVRINIGNALLAII